MFVRIFFSFTVCFSYWEFFDFIHILFEIICLSANGFRQFSYVSVVEIDDKLVILYLSKSTLWVLGLQQKWKPIPIN